MHSSLSKRWAGLDLKVWICFITLFVLSAVLLAYKVATNAPCTNFSISATGKLSHPEANNNHTFYINEQIGFSTSIPDSNHTIVWDFDDKTDRKSGPAVTHAYLKEGYYLVKAIIDGKCLQSFNVRITQSNSTSSISSAPAISPIISADIVSAGDEAVFNTSAAGANYEWSIEEMPHQPKQTTNQAKFIFTQPGHFTVVLKVDNDKTYRKMIQVNSIDTPLSQEPALPPVSATAMPPVLQEPLPPLPDKTTEETQPEKPEPVKQEPAAPPSKTYDQLPEPAIKAMVQDVIEGKKDVEDFKNILCNGAGTKVMANNQSTTFAALCNELKEKKGVLIIKKKRKIESFKVVRDEAAGNCVKVIYIQYK